MCEQGKKAESGRCMAKPITPATVAEEPPPNVMEIKSFYQELNSKHQEQLMSLAKFLSASSGEQQKELYLNQLLKEI